MMIFIDYVAKSSVFLIIIIFMQVHDTFPYVDCRPICDMAISDYYWKEVTQVRSELLGHETVSVE